MAFWNPWHGCHKFSDGCKHCYIHKGNIKRGIDTNIIEKSDKFSAPIEKNKSGDYKMKAKSIVYVSFNSDFFLPDADEWRKDCWRMIKERSDLHFLFLTKRIERFYEVIPDDWQNGYPNVTIGCTVENQSIADTRLSFFKSLPIVHKNIICQPLLENIHLEDYLENIELVVVGGESDALARPLNYDWVLNIREQCIRKKVPFEFRQCGTHFIKDGKQYTLSVRELCSQARKAQINTKKN